MSVTQFIAGQAPKQSDSLAPIFAGLNAKQTFLGGISVNDLLDYFDALGEALIEDRKTRRINGMMFLSSWLRRKHLEQVLNHSLGRSPEHLDHFMAHQKGRIAARAQGLVSTRPASSSLWPRCASIWTTRSRFSTTNFSSSKARPSLRAARITWAPEHLW